MVNVMKCFKLEKIFSQSIYNYILSVIKWSVSSIIIGICGGVIGTLFVKSLNFVTLIRTNYNWIIYLLPIAGLLIPLIYGVLKVTSFGTNQVFESAKTNKKISILLLPAIFLSSAITHLFGGSAGREGAALQIGGSMASFLGKIFKIDQQKHNILIMSGMAAVFSAVFCTPLTAAIFAVEVITVGYLYSYALFPSFIASLTAFLVSTKLGCQPEHFRVKNFPSLNSKTILFVVLVSVLGALVSILFCKTMHKTSDIFSKYIKNPYFRILIGGLAVVLLSVIFSSGDYNGSGINIIENIFNDGELKYEAFLLKILFTAITISSGYKGGEIVPTLFIGATFGGTIASILGMSVPFGAALGIAALFCGVTNCPISSLFLCIEFFGTDGILFFGLCIFISFLLSGYTGLFSGQTLLFSKTTDKKININAK